MGTDRDTVPFVLTSSVRKAILQAVSEGPRPTDEVLATVEASTSAVYNGLNELEEHRLITNSDRDWELTGSGRLLADVVTEYGRYEQVFDDVGEYFQTHDASVLPRRFRLRIGSLAGAELIEATETTPHRAVAEVVDRLEAADSVKVISPIYIESYEAAMPEISGARLVLNERVIEWAASDQSMEADVSGELDIRIADVSFALGVTDSELLLSLPLLDGSYDSQSELVVENDCARAWGNELFEFVWEDAVPATEYDLP